MYATHLHIDNSYWPVIDALHILYIGISLFITEELSGRNVSEYLRRLLRFDKQYFQSCVSLYFEIIT